MDRAIAPRAKGSLRRISAGVALFCAVAWIGTAQTQEPAPSPAPASPASQGQRLDALAMNVMPMPASVQMGTVRLPLTQNFAVALEGYKEARLDRAVERFLSELSRQTGIPIARRAADSSKAVLIVHIAHGSKEIQDLDEDESYTLQISNFGAKINAANPLGAMHGLQTFLQLVEAAPGGFSVPNLYIEDRPRFAWRGLMIDSCRHFIPLEAIRRNLNGMAAVKLNVFHWHLSENQGFRVESKTFPKLQEMGSDGLYYTQAEVREVIAYARDRGIRVIPEFDIPGHSTAWFVGYPELASGPGPYEIERRWGIFDPAMDPTREETYKFLEKLLGEMAKLFPDHYFHIGGDEVNGKQWDANPTIQAFMREHGLKNNDGLQHYFNERVGKILIKNHKTMVGWDEILAPGLRKDSVIQSWRGAKSMAEAARLGYRSLLSNGYYLDYMWPASQHYAVDPMTEDTASLTAEEKARILGGEACMWAEFISPENIDTRIWPRTAAIAERLWSPAEVSDVDSLYRRMDAESARLELTGMDHKSSSAQMLGRLAGSDNIAHLRVLADVVEPVKIYQRAKTARAANIIQTSADPLNRMADTVAPESEAARIFTKEVDALVSGNFKDAALEAEIRAQLMVWRANDAALAPSLAKSFLLMELAPISHDLANLGAAGIEALDYIDGAQHPADGWKTRQLAVVEQAKISKADLLLPVAPAIQQLVESAAGVAPGK
jgi:hexosaminidase